MKPYSIQFPNFKTRPMSPENLSPCLYTSFPTKLQKVNLLGKATADCIVGIYYTMYKRRGTTVLHRDCLFDSETSDHSSLNIKVYYLQFEKVNLDQ